MIDGCGSSTAVDAVATVVANDQVAPSVYLVTLECPEVAASVRPGQFVQLLIAADRPRILRRPFSVYQVDGDTLEILYQVVGTGTAELTTLVEGAEVRVLGPLGTGWTVPQSTSRALLVTGGLGAAPLAMLARELTEAGVEVHVAMGAPTAVRLVGSGPYVDSACRLNVSTDDGSAGRQGYCTELAAELLDTFHFDYVATCGPEPMQRIVADLAAEAGVPCEVSLERRMACGIGACLSCVVSTVDGLRKACVDGPVFDARKVVWDA